MRSNELRLVVGLGPICSGSTSVWNYLVNNTSFNETSNKELKESNYLWVRCRKKELNDNCIDYSGSISSLKEYENFLNQCNDELYGLDISPNYLYFYKEVIESINSLALRTKPRLFVILRDPLKRMVSQYRSTRFEVETENLPMQEAFSKERRLMLLKDGPIKPTTRNVIPYELDYFGHSNYVEALVALKKEFGENFKVYIFEEFFSDINSSMKDLCNFVGVEWQPNMKLARHGVKGASRLKWLNNILVAEDSSLRTKLRNSPLGPKIRLLRDKIITSSLYRKKHESFKIDITDDFSTDLINIVNGVEDFLGREIESWSYLKSDFNKQGGL